MFVSALVERDADESTYWDSYWRPTWSFVTTYIVTAVGDWNIPIAPYYDIETYMLDEMNETLIHEQTNGFR